MIESIDRIVNTPIRECPLLVEGVLGESPLGILRTAWFTIEPTADDWFHVTDESNGVSIEVPGYTMVKWLKPQDMNSPAIQAELIVGLAQMGIEL